MASKGSLLTDEINAVLDRLADEGQPWRAAWIANMIVVQHMDGIINGEHKDYWMHCGYATTREQVTRCISSRAGETKKAGRVEAQYKLPGFEHLQSYYMVNRSGEDIGVSVHSLSDDEIDAKATLYRDMGAACYAHADELMKFKTERGGPATAVRA